MSSNQQPFFVRGPSPLARLTVFGLAALVLMFVDSRFRSLDSVRSVIATIVHPMQRAALLPLSAWKSASGWFESRNALQVENVGLRDAALANAQYVQGYRSLEAENAQLRTMLALKNKLTVKSVGAEVVQAGRDPFSQRIFIDRGTQHTVREGLAVIDGVGVIGQVTRAHPFLSEVTLITEKDHAIPVRNERTGVRSVMFGQGGEQLPELRFVAATVDVQVGDVLATSGLDGMYPSALAVARVLSVSREPGQAFLKIRCQPLAGVTSARSVLVMASDAPPIELPAPADEAERASQKTRARGKR